MEAGIASTDCSVCFQPYNSKDKLPLSLSCGHTFCSQCLTDLAKKEPSCPKCRARIDMTTARKVFDLIPNQQEKRPNNNNVLEQPPRMPTSESGILCMNGEPAKWTGRKAECMKCNIVREGWSCKTHTFHLCDVCAKTCFSSSVCPNGHNPKWSGDWRNPNTCEKCNKRKVSLPCKTCKVRHCWNCKVNDRKARRCKKHNVEVIYREDKYCGVQGCLNQQSQICGGCRARCSQHNGDFEKVTLPCMTVEDFDRNRQCSKWECSNIACWSCRYCELRLCDICATTVMKKESCPNDHKTTWTGEKQRCACCNATKSGFKCIACDYNLCESCSEKSPIIYEREPKEETCSMM